MLDHVKNYLSKGLHVMPTASGSKKPITQSGSFKDATNDYDIAMETWQDNEDCNVAIHLGPSGYFAVNLENSNSGPSGIQAWEYIQAEYGKLKTLTAITPSGGEHHIFKLPNGISMNSPSNSPVPGIDIVSTGCYILVAPSVIGKKKYRWLNKSGEFEPTEIQIAPNWLISIINKRHTSTRTPTGGYMSITRNEFDSMTDAIRYISPEDKDIWIKVGMAIKDCVNAEEGEKIWASWSEQASHFNEAKCHQIWTSMSPRCGITIKTIFKLAADRDWRWSRKGPGANIDPEADPNHDADIRSYFSTIADSSVYPSVKAEALCRYVILHDTRDKIYDMASEEFLNSGNVSRGIKAKIKFKDKEGKQQGWDFLNDPKTRRMSSKNLVMSPDKKVSWPKFNLFKGFQGANTSVDPAEVIKATKIILKNLTLVCDGDEKLGMWVMQWLAYPLQHPGAKMNTCVIAISRKVGVGKSVILNKMMAGIYGSYYKPLSPHDLSNNFNNWIKDTLYCCGDDIATDDNTAYKISGPLRSLITEDHARWESKGVDSGTVRNYCNFSITTNEKMPVKIKQDARRFCIVGTDKVKGMSHSEYKYLHTIAESNPALCLKVFMSIKCPPNMDKLDAPDTPLKTRLALLSIPSTEGFVSDFDNGKLGIDPTNPFSIIKLMKVYKEWTKISGKGLSSKDKLAEELMRFGYDKKGGRNHSGWCHEDGNRNVSMTSFLNEFKAVMALIEVEEWDFDNKPTDFRNDDVDEKRIPF